MYRTRDPKYCSMMFNYLTGSGKKVLQQIADNQIRLVQEQQILEDKQAELFGIRLPSRSNPERHRRRLRVSALLRQGRYKMLDPQCIAPGSLDTSLSHAAGLSDIAVCHA